MLFPTERQLDSWHVALNPTLVLWIKVSASLQFRGLEVRGWEAPLIFYKSQGSNPNPNHHSQTTNQSVPESGPSQESYRFPWEKGFPSWRAESGVYSGQTIFEGEGSSVLKFIACCGNNTLDFVVPPPLSSNGGSSPTLTSFRDLGPNQTSWARSKMTHP